MPLEFMYGAETPKDALICNKTMAQNAANQSVKLCKLV
ncbi:hypothetical protein GARC_4427 [Paraglaciecola arctica BSs20135]|uniref:Uncharacterized protein n=1 Tax=Paraglaciecola arctica BSs20135 TaxID=493475 RepID=K6XL54_9ALTE|nr:hypothetical protein GARC_4427 [Paraglaciecola arctica BSs20135]